jgi:hypothetical protein
MTVTIGDTFARVSGEGPAFVKVLGQHGADYVLTDAEEFGPPFTLTGAEFLAQYAAADGEPLGQRSEADAWQDLTAEKLSQFTAEAEQAAHAARAAMLPPEATFDPNWTPPEPPPADDEE